MCTVRKCDFDVLTEWFYPVFRKTIFPVNFSTFIDRWTGKLVNFRHLLTVEQVNRSIPHISLHHATRFEPITAAHFDQSYKKLFYSRSCSFLRATAVPAGAAEARISYGDSVCLSVCLYVWGVTTRWRTKPSWDRDSGSSSYDSLESLVSNEVM